MRVTSSTSGTSQSSGNPVLKVGSSGSAVADLQRRLAAAGFSPGPADGQFGPKTDAAVRSYQRANGLSADGVVGNQTWSSLRGSSASAPPPPSSSAEGATGTPTLSVGARGPAVRDMQRRLAAAGYSPGPDDGQFGPGTRSALMRFQRANGLSADGVCGPKTWARLSSSFQSHGVTGADSSSDDVKPTLKQGASGSAVSRLQRLLNDAGCNPGPVDGQFGPGTRSAVEVYQSSRGLTCDGVVGPQTWAALEGGAKPVRGTTPTSGPLRQRILQVAQGEIGTLETGTNSGPCLKYPRFFGRGSEAWCADFVSYVMTNAGKPFNDPYCPSIVNKMKASGQWKGRSDPQPGDIVLFDWNGDGTSDHVGIVKGVNGDGSIQTIEGNTENSAGQQGVWERTRSLSTVLGFASP
ncbi:MAG TPA: peptidoglycan-binding protein [Myxococcales bacterium]